MRLFVLVHCLIFGFVAQEARAYEFGLGVDRFQSCLLRGDNEQVVCPFGPGASLSLGINVWGNEFRGGYQLYGGGQSTPTGDSSWHFPISVGDSIFNHSPALALGIVVVALLVTTVGYALLAPFSSRLDIGLVGRGGTQMELDKDAKLWRREGGMYLRAFVTQYVPIYIYGSALWSRQDFTFETLKERHDVLVKGVGLGVMGPKEGGLYFHGIWERSTIQEPTAQRLIEDAGEIKILKSSVSKMLDGSTFELGYVWYL